MSALNFSSSDLRHYATAKSCDRGENYYHQGAVIAVIQRGNLLQGEVQGNDFDPYRVSVSWDDGDSPSATCTCPYDFGGWCKHIVAVLLTYLREPDSIQQGQTLEQLLARLSDAQAKSLLQHLVAEFPPLLDAIERQVNLLSPTVKSAKSTQSPRRPTIDPQPFRRQTRQIFRDAIRHWEYGGEDDPLSDGIFDLLENLQTFLERGEGDNALVILEAITETCAENWDEAEEYGAYSDDIVAALDAAWTEAILTAELAPAEKVDLKVNLEFWQDALCDRFAASLIALDCGWDDPRIQRILQGNTAELEEVEDSEEPDFRTGTLQDRATNSLAQIRLKILARQQRYTEYLYLAQAEGQTQEYLTMLVQLDRANEAMEAAQAQLAVMGDAFAVAKVLQVQGEAEKALTIALKGLALPGNCPGELATWTSELAEELGEAEAALASRIKAFEARPSFEDYRKVAQLAGETWENIQPELLTVLRNATGWGLSAAKIDIFLHEGEIDDAIATASNLSSYDSHLIHRVMEAVTPARPDWVIENACRRAESIMDAKKAQYYHYAVQWLSKAKAAYTQANRQAEWSAYYAQLRQTHARKYKLMGLLKQLERP